MKKVDKMADMEVDEEDDMVVNEVADMEVKMVTNMVADEVVDMEVNKKRPSWGPGVRGRGIRGPGGPLSGIQGWWVRWVGEVWGSRGSVGPAGGRPRSRGPTDL